MKLILVRGIPGSGKTTFVNNQRQTDNVEYSYHFEADMYFEVHNSLSRQFEYRFDASRLKEAHEMCLFRTREALTNGGKVYVSNTFSTIKEMEPYVKMARELGAKIEIHEMSEIPVVEGFRKNIHNVPQHVIDKMIQRWDLSMPPDWSNIYYCIHRGL